MFSLDLSTELNSRQIEVVKSTEGPLLVLAGAGSGKTKSIIYRVAWLLKQQKVAPWNILVVTFTNKAARELQDRLEKLLGYSVRSLWVGTFHSLCLRILRFESRHLAFNSNFSIYDDDDQKSVLKKIYKAHGFDIKKVPLQKVMAYLGKNKNKLLLPEDLDSMDSDVAASGEFMKSFKEIYRLYQQQLLLNQALDFDDILLFTAKLLQSNDEVRSKYQSMFRYIMIDEYQDTNYAQFQIIFQLANQHRNICVVGDDDQAIYSWRGASIRNILEFERDYNEVKTVRLEQNYRSTMSILDLANAVIAKNYRRHNKLLWSELGRGEAPELLSFEDETQEARCVAEKVFGMWKSGAKLNNIAILYRTNAQSRNLEYAFMQQKIPYVIVGSLYFYQRMEIKDILAYLKVIANPDDNESMLRIINEPPRGIGQTTINKLIAHAGKYRCSLFNCLTYIEQISEINSGGKRKVAEFAQLMASFKSLADKANVLEVVKSIIEELKWIEHYRNSKDQKDISRAENLIEFVTATSEFSERFLRENERLPLLQDYLPHIALQTDLDKVQDDQDTARLMTIHNAKGLEFDTIFIVGVEDELLPHRMSMDAQDGVEEERRLFYVGITRAKLKLCLSYVKFRRLYDTFYYPKPSVFIQELDPRLFLDGKEDPMLQMAPRTRPKTNKVILESEKHYRIGQRVFHDEYGYGKILNVDGVGAAATLTISFEKGTLTKIIGSFIRTDNEA